MFLAGEAGHSLPTQFEDLDALTPFGAIYRYEDYEASVSLDRVAARRILLQLRVWVESKLQEHTPPTVE